MTELDLNLKIGVRRLLWSMGYSTRLDVQLRGDRAPSARSKAPETFTDLDVLGVVVTPGHQLSMTIADCKAGRHDKPTARMFWARGVADLFGADHVMLVREHDVSDAPRQLSSRLGITVLPTGDLANMQALYSATVPDSNSPLGILFSKPYVERHLSAFTGLDKRLDSLLEYREFDYWIYESHRNPIQLVAHLKDARKNLDPQNPIHLALFFDLAWLYVLTIIRAINHVRGAFLHDIDRGIQEYLFGGPTNLKEKVQTAELLQGLKPKGTPDLDHLPDYYGNLRELVTRLLKRPNAMQSALRYAEVVSAFSSAKVHVSLIDTFGADFDPMAAKLVADVCGFLVAAGDLDGNFRTQARAYLLAENVEPAGQPESVEPTLPLEAGDE